MKGAAKCNNHCELQNSVNQLTIERRCALGAFLRACLCQCFYVLLLNVSDGNMVIVQQVSMIVASNTVTATRRGSLLTLLFMLLFLKHMNMTSSKATC